MLTVAERVTPPYFGATSGQSSGSCFGRTTPLPTGAFVRHTISRDLWILMLGTLAVLIPGAHRLLGQASSCAHAPPADLLTKETVYLSATIADSGNSALTVQADLLAQEVAEMMRTRMGSTADQDSQGYSAAKARSVPAELIATMHPDGSATRRATSRTGDTLATSVLLSAFDSVRKNGDGAIVWPDGYVADSLVVHLVLRPIGPNPDGSEKKATHSRFGVFPILEYDENPALLKPNNLPLNYPNADLARRVTGSLFLEFVVDSSGYVVASTMHEVWPNGKPRLRGVPESDYDELVEASKATVAKWRFYPAAEGKCHMQQTIQLPIPYELPRVSN